MTTPSKAFQTWGHSHHRRSAGDPRRYPEIDLALLHLGETKVLGIIVTMDAKQGVQMLRTVNPQRARHGTGIAHYLPHQKRKPGQSTLHALVIESVARALPAADIQTLVRDISWHVQPHQADKKVES